MIVVVPGPIRSGLDSDSFSGVVDPGVSVSLSRAGNSLVLDFSSALTVDQRVAIVEMATQVVDPDAIERERLREIIEEDAPAGGGGSDGDPPSTAPTVTFIGGIGSIFFRWTEVANTDLVTYRLFVRDGSAPTTADDTYLVASGVGMTAASVRKLADGTAIVGDGSVTYYGIVVAEDADGAGPDSAVASGVPAQVTSDDIAANAVTADMLVANDALIGALATVDLSTVNLEAVNIDGGSIAIAVSEDGGADQAFSGTSLPVGWTSTITGPVGTSSPTGAVSVTVINAGAPAGASGSSLKIDMGPSGQTSATLAAAGNIDTGFTASDFEVSARVRAALNPTSTFPTENLRFMGRAGGTAWDDTTEDGLFLDLDYPVPEIRSIINGSESTLAVLPALSDLSADWHQVRFRVVAGQVQAKVWAESDAEPDWTTVQQAGVLAPGPVRIDWQVWPLVGNSTGQEWFIDQFDVTTYATGFKINPDGTGEWPALYDQGSPYDSGLLAPGGSFAGGFRFTRIGPIVYYEGYTDRDDSFGTGVTDTGIDIPVGMRPAAEVVGPAYTGYNSAEQYRYRFATDGTLNIQRTGVITTFMTATGFYYV